MATAISAFIERNWPWLLLCCPIVAYAAWIGTLVVPHVVRIVVPEVTRAVLGS